MKDSFNHHSCNQILDVAITRITSESLELLSSILTPKLFSFLLKTTKEMLRKAELPMVWDLKTFCTGTSGLTYDIGIYQFYGVDIKNLQDKPGFPVLIDGHFADNYNTRLA